MHLVLRFLVQHSYLHLVAEDVIKERLDKARREIATKDKYKHVVVNDDVMRAKDDIVKIIEENMK